ncbi:DEAD/DEAH box helicase [uncultured Clostridium sp.]|uniref:DEAD/DEAH box helicase n=1 Tax=uncultured Clostridium sp. TaxID=59620 RepID=UPI0025D1355E|nr:DEAD/DEAH box helicase family protein [uncultured Clostridium sp.]
MRYTLTEAEIEDTVRLLIDKYNISTNMLNKLLDKKSKKESEFILNMNNIETTRETLCRLLVIREGLNLFSNKELRKKILDKLSDEQIIKLYNKYPSKGANITTASYMRKPLSKKNWVSGQLWANDFIKEAGFPIILAGIATKKENTKQSIETIEPRRKVPDLVEYQIKIKEKLLSILRLQEDKTRCMISLPTGGGKTRVAVEGFLDWMQQRFEEEKYMVWIAQSEELCEQCISCIEQMWSSREFILPLTIYRYFSKYEMDAEDLHGGVVVASINKIYNRIKNDDSAIKKILSNTGAIIIDEAHRASSHMYDVLFKKAEELTNNKLFPVCGLSATPGRNTIISDDVVGKLVDRFQENLITPEFEDDEKYSSNPLEYFKEHKYLSKVNHIVYKSNIEYTLTDEEIKDLEENGEYSQSHLKKLASDNNRNALIIKRLLKIEKNSPTLVYACTVEHAKFLSTMLNIIGRKSACIDSDTNKTERRIIIKQFTEGTIDFLFNYGVLTTGFDAPKTENIVICRPINSNILYEQIVGRGIRGTRFGGTEECNIIDFSDNIHNLGVQQAYMRFKDYWDNESDEYRD